MSPVGPRGMPGGKRHVGHIGEGLRGSARGVTYLGAIGSFFLGLFGVAFLGGAINDAIHHWAPESVIVEAALLGATLLALGCVGMYFSILHEGFDADQIASAVKSIIFGLLFGSIGAIVGAVATFGRVSELISVVATVAGFIGGVAIGVVVGFGVTAEFKRGLGLGGGVSSEASRQFEQSIADHADIERATKADRATTEAIAAKRAKDRETESEAYQR
jgi:hypothetical protein